MSTTNCARLSSCTKNVEIQKIGFLKNVEIAQAISKEKKMLSKFFRLLE
jgi:hypothetical protein